MVRVENWDQQMDDEALARALQEEFAREARSSSRPRPPSTVTARTVLTGVAPSARQEPQRQRSQSHSRSSSATRAASFQHGASARRQPSGRRSQTPPLTEQPQFQQQASAPPQQASVPRSTPSFSSSRRSLDDEEFARQLEQTFREEERAASSLDRTRAQQQPQQRGSSRRNLYNHNSAPLPGIPSEYDYATRLEQSMRQEEIVMGRAESVNNSELSADAELARELQKALDREEKERRKKGRVTPVTSRTSSEASDPCADYDMAMKMEQELMDEELARQLAKAEEKRLSQVRRDRLVSAGAAAHPSGEPPRSCSLQKVFGLLVPVILMAGAAAGIIYYFTRGDNSNGIFPSPEDFRQEDPFTAKSPAESDRWSSNGQGLELEVVRATDPTWYEYFADSIVEWDDGIPDALTLTTSIADYDYACEPINYKLKVCNGDYGNTRWRGINKILLTNGYIFASAARMNEYYLKDSDEDQKRYTMCHENGHGFGLPHSDESFTNKDLGNCMDYTNNPSVNKQPDITNFEFLTQLYGTVPGSPTLAPQTTAPGSRRHLRQSNVSTKTDPIPDWVMERWRNMEDELEKHAHGAESRNGWRVLHQNDFGESHEVDIGHGYTIRVHKLLA